MACVLGRLSAGQVSETERSSFAWKKQKCIHCKGYHEAEECPVFASKQVFAQLQDVGTGFQGNAPTPFVGRYGYPDIHVGLLSITRPVDDAWLYDAPNEWAAKDYRIPQIVGYRSSLLNSRFEANVREMQTPFLDVAQEIAMAARPPDVEVELADKPSMRFITDPYVPPTGPVAELQKALLTSNPRVKTRVERAVSDTDLKSKEALISLYEHGIDENQLSRLLSVGTLGVGHNRKLVPTRWSITAVDDTLGKQELAKVRDESSLLGYRAYIGSYLGNTYILLFFQESWSYELFETFVPASKGAELQYSTDFEPFKGRTSYAEQCAGGYYTVRLAIAEKLNELKRQGSCLALRFITEEYTTPLGVWVTREATRKALDAKPIEFSSKELLLAYAKHLARHKFGLDISNVLKDSKLLLAQRQKRLWEWV